jgi:hypothetical protein
MKKLLILCFISFIFISSCRSTTFSQINVVKKSFNVNISIYATPVEGEYIVIDNQENIWFIKLENLGNGDYPSILYKEKIIIDIDNIGVLPKPIGDK